MIRLTVAREDLCPFAGGNHLQSFSCFHQGPLLRDAFISPRSIPREMVVPLRWLPEGAVKRSVTTSPPGPKCLGLSSPPCLLEKAEEEAVPEFRCHKASH